MRQPPLLALSAHSSRSLYMFEKVLIANRGDQQPAGCAAAQPNCVQHEVLVSNFDAETVNV
jgi:hypothetical protein